MEQQSLRQEIISKLRPTGRLIESRINFDEPPMDTNMACELVKAFRLHSQKVLLVDASSKRQWTGSELLDTCGRIATGLISQVQVQPNDTIMTICEHTGVEILAALGIVLAGGALFGTSPQDGYAELKIICELAKPNVIIASSRHHWMASALRQNVAGLEDTKIVWLDNPMKHFDSGIVADLNNNCNINNSSNNNTNDESIESIMKRDQVILFEDLINGPLDEQLIEEMFEKRIDASKHMLTYMLTSGSTGRPKLVPSTHEELIYGLYSMISSTRYPVGCADANNQAVANESHLLLPIGSDSVLAGDLPLDHGAGLNTMFLALCLGAKYVVMASYEVDTFWQTVNDHRITISIASTTFGYKLFSRLKQLIDSNNDCNNNNNDYGMKNCIPRWDLSSLKFVTCCGAKLAFIELIREIQQVYPHIHVSQAYGCTEIGFISIVSPSESLEDKYLQSTGYLMPGLLAKVVGDEKSTPKGAFDRGELHVWAQSKFKGYRCHSFDDGEKIYANCHDQEGLFYKSGDQAHCDHEGRLYIHGRFKDTLVLMEDWKILPSELEEVVNLHPLVEQTAVIGIPDPELPGCHKPKAFCKLISRIGPELQQVDCDELRSSLLENNVEFISQHIYKFVADRTARPKHLTGGVRIVDEFPRVGLLNKVDRKALITMD